MAASSNVQLGEPTREIVLQRRGGNTAHMKELLMSGGDGDKLVNSELDSPWQSGQCLQCGPITQQNAQGIIRRI